MAVPAQVKSVSSRTKMLLLMVGIVVAVALVAAVGAVAVGASANQASGNYGGPGSGGSALANAVATSTVHRPGPPPLTVTGISPAAGASDVATNAALTVTYSKPITSTTPTPKVSPAVSGTWTHQGEEMTFVPEGGWVPYTTETVSVPVGASAGFTGHTSASTPTRSTSTFTVQPGSETRLEQLLAELNYLPFTFEPSTSSSSGTSALAAEPTTASAIQTSPVPGTLDWSWSNVPPTLKALWTPGEANVMDKGAVMAFESDHGMTMDGVAGPGVWRALLNAVAARQVDSQPYDYLLVTENLPETLTVYRNGQVIYTSQANTGVPGAATATGTFPVYSRYASQTMTGTDVDGTKYVDPGIPWIAYFNGGDAVHGYVRASYGFPQSNGCVELPVNNAAQVWKMDPYGTLVTVTQ